MLDSIIGLYVIWQVIKSLGSRPSEQLNKLLIRLLIFAAFYGFFIITRLTGLIRDTVEWLTTETGILISVASFVVAIVVILQLRNRILEKLDEIVDERFHTVLSMLLAITRSVLMISLLLIVLTAFPLGLFDGMLQNSVAAEALLSVYRQVAGVQY